MHLYLYLCFPRFQRDILFHFLILVLRAKTTYKFERREHQHIKSLKNSKNIIVTYGML